MFKLNAMTLLCSQVRMAADFSVINVDWLASGDTEKDDLISMLLSGAASKLRYMQGDYFSGKPEKVREFFLNQGKVRKNRQSEGKVMETMIVPYFRHQSKIQILPPKAL